MESQTRFKKTDISVEADVRRRSYFVTLYEQTDVMPEVRESCSRKTGDGWNSKPDFKMSAFSESPLDGQRKREADYLRMFWRRFPIFILRLLLPLHDLKKTSQFKLGLQHDMSRFDQSKVLSTNPDSLWCYTWPKSQLSHSFQDVKLGNYRNERSSHHVCGLWSRKPLLQRCCRRVFWGIPSYE